MSVTLNEIRPVTCDAPYQSSVPNGQIIALNLTMDVIAWDTSSYGTFSLHPGEFRGYDSEGNRMNTVESPIVHGCLADDSVLIPRLLTTGEKATGDVLLDVTDTEGSIAWVIESANVGMEWEYDLNGA